MTRQRKSQAVRMIKQRAQDGQYRMTEHALTEMDDDNLTEADVIGAIVKGTLDRKQTGDPRGPRYIFRGKSEDGRDVEVVCTLAGSKVSIITVYEVE
jgi:hypothetical protein